jgi:hypothetical protein
MKSRRSNSPAPNWAEVCEKEKQQLKTSRITSCIPSWAEVAANANTSRSRVPNTTYSPSAESMNVKTDYVKYN